MGFFDFLYKGLVRPMGCLLFFILMLVLGILMELGEGVVGMFTGNKMETYREYITDKEYDKAKEYAISNELDVKEVLSEQTYEYMKQGDFAAAQNLCAHQDQMYVYFHTLTSNIQALYDNNGTAKLALAFSMIPYPSPTSEYISDDFKKQWGYGKSDYVSKDEIVNENNRAIESLGNYVKAKGSTNGMSQLLEYLQPTTESGKINNDEVNRIKKKFQ